MSESKQPSPLEILELDLERVKGLVMQLKSFEMILEKRIVVRKEALKFSKKLIEDNLDRYGPE